MPRISGNGSSNRVNGSSVSDNVYAFGGNDVINSGFGNDRIYGGTGNDTANGSEGNDKIYGQDGSDRLVGGIGADTLNGGIGNDRLEGGSQGDSLVGGTGNDALYGGAGHDMIDGNDGNDTLDGGRGDDFLRGGADNDTYNHVYLLSGHDVIYDTSGSSDLLDLTEFSLSQVSLQAADYLNSSVQYAQDGLVDSLVITAGAHSIIILEYFANTSAAGYASAAGFGQIETIAFNDTNLNDGIDANFSFNEILQLLSN